MSTYMIKINPFQIELHYLGKIISTLNIGYQTIINTYFKNDEQNAYEIEMAIIAIEDQIANINKTWPIIDVIMTDNDDIKSITQLFDGNNQVTIEQVEIIFNRIADIVMGSPKQELSSIDSIKFRAVLIILRELMHHLGIKKVKWN